MESLQSLLAKNNLEIFRLSTVQHIKNPAETVTDISEDVMGKKSNHFLIVQCFPNEC